ncbi:unnamed protein product [Camellia sinensis]
MAVENSSVWGNFDRVKNSFRPPFGFMKFKSRISTLKEVIETLKNDEINIIGICGMSGVGKTTMVKQVAVKAQKENLFDEIVMVVFGSLSTSLSDIQCQIADQLGLKLEGETLIQRAACLRRRLANGKRILLALDAVSEEPVNEVLEELVFDQGFDLEAIGIPIRGENRGCKVVLTSEDDVICSQMGAQKKIQVKPLTKEEAWHLFKEMAGDSVDAPDIRSIAEQVVTECLGLPLALRAIGRVLKNKSNFVWTYALKRLRDDQEPRIRSLCTLTRGTAAWKEETAAWTEETAAWKEETARPHLRLSYDSLDEEAKSLFLLCCLYPACRDIHIEELVRCGMGLRIFKDINGLEEARNRVRLLVDWLKSYCLLLDGDKDENESIKMHDLAREVGRTGNNAFCILHGYSAWPTYITYEGYTSISMISDKITKLPESLRCPKLRTLLLACMNNSLKTPNCFFEGMRTLQVLYLELSIALLPSSLQFLRNLHSLTLNLPNYELENITAIGELLNLEILSFCAPSVKVLPEEIGRLANLTLLDLTGCHRLERISPGVISGLVRLQELYMMGSFSNWEADKGESKEGRRNASLRELQSLSDLKILEVYIPDAALLPRNPLFADLTKYKIRIGDNGWWSVFPFQKHLLLKLDKSIALHGGVSKLLKCTELLSLRGKGSRNVVHELVQDGIQHLKYLSIESCDMLFCLVDTTDLSLDSSAAIFPILESLKLDDLRRLKEICHGQLPEGSFGKLRTLILQLLPSLMHFLVEDPAQTTVSLHNLRSVELDRCNGLRNLFSLSMAQGLVQLQELCISHCEMMKEVIWEGRGEDGHATNKIEFPRLEYMALIQLEGLTGFSRGIDKIEFPQLKKLHIKCLPKIMSFFPIESTLHSDENCNATLQSIFPQQVAFPSLEKLELVGLLNASDLWASELSTESFCKLRSLKVEDCHGLVKNVVPVNIIKMSPSLEKVKIYNCDLVEDVFGFGGHQEIPVANIRRLIVRCCGSLRNLFSPSIVRGLVHLQELTIDGCSMMEEVIWEGRGEDGHVTNKIEFPRLEYISLTELEVLTGFSRGIDKIEFPQLKKLHIKYLPKGKSFFPSESILHSDENRNATLLSIFPQQILKLSRDGNEEPTLQGMGRGWKDVEVVFPRLEELELVDLPNASDLWCSELSTGSFCKLRSLMVKDCHRLVRNVVPAHILKVPPNLEKVEIYNCDSVEEVFRLGGHQGNPLENIRTLIVRCCGSLRNMFSPSVAGCFVHLQELIIHDCSAMEAVVANEDEEQMGGDRIYVTLFAQLKHLELRDLPSLGKFCHAIHDWEMPSLHHLEAVNCPEMQTFSPGFVHAPNLYHVEVEAKWIRIKRDLNKTIQHFFEKKEVEEEREDERKSRERRETTKKIRKRRGKEGNNEDNNDDGDPQQR